MNVPRLVSAAILLTVGLAVPAVSNAQSEFPLTGRWGYFDYGTRAVSDGELDRVCMSEWDSYAPDGAFIGFEMDAGGRVSALFAGFCVIFGRRISCDYLLDSETGSSDSSDQGEMTFDGPDIVDYVLLGEDGKHDYHNSWTYIRCPATAGFSVG